MCACALRMGYRISFFFVVVVLSSSSSTLFLAFVGQTDGAMNELYTEHFIYRRRRCRCCRRRKIRQPIIYVYPKTILK